MKEDKSFQQKLWIWIAAFVKGAKPLVLYYLMPSLCMALGYVIAHPDMTATEFFTYGGNFYTAVGMALTLYLLYRGSKKRGHRFFEDASLYLENVKWKKAAGFFAFGVTAAVAISSAITLLSRLGLTGGYSEATQKMLRGRDILFTVVTTVITSPVTEEVVFRGYMLNTFLEHFDEKKAVLIVSAVFALCHVQPLWILYAFAMGLLLAVLSIKEDNILYGILMHIGFNAPSMINWLITSSVPASRVLFEGWWMVLAYGLIAAMLSVLLVRKYRSMD